MKYNTNLLHISQIHKCIFIKFSILFEHKKEAVLLFGQPLFPYKSNPFSQISNLPNGLFISFLSLSIILYES